MKYLGILLFLFCSFFKTQAQFVDISQIDPYTSPALICAGSNVTFRLNSLQNLTNPSTISLQLSDASGNFAAPVTLATVQYSLDNKATWINGNFIWTSNVTNSYITVTLPVSTPAGTGYKVKVHSSNPNLTGGVNNGALTVSAASTPLAMVANTSYGVNQWYGHAYTWVDNNTNGTPYLTPAQVGIQDFYNTANYKGHIVLDSLNFDNNYGNGGMPSTLHNGTSIPCGTAYYTNFSIRFRRTQTFSPGYYYLNTGADDGSRLSIDGGTTWLLNNFKEQVYTMKATDTCGVFLSGSYNLVLEYFQRPTVARVSFKSVLLKTHVTVSTPPANSTICVGANTGFSLKVNGTATVYQWQLSTNGGTNYSNLANGGIYSNVTTASLALTGVTSGMNGYKYRAYVMGACAIADTSAPATLTVGVLPIVTSSPNNVTVCNGSNAKFAVSAKGSGLTYKWQISTDSITFTPLSNGGVYSNTTSDTLKITGATAALNSNQYRVVISGACAPPATSSPATLTINNLPTVTASPVTTAICANTSTFFSAQANGTGLSYQWQFSTDSINFNNIVNGGVYSNATTPTLNLSSVPASMQGYQYRLVATGACPPAATSSKATLIVNLLPAISSPPASTTICAGKNASFAVVATGTALSYQWQSSTDGINFTALSNGGVYSNVTTAVLALSGAPAALNANQFRVIVSGTCQPPATSAPALLNVDNPPAISKQPDPTSTCEGSNALFTVAATGKNLNYQWAVSTDGGTTFNPTTDGALYNGSASPTLTLSNATLTMNGYKYQVAVSGSCTPAVLSGSALLTINNVVSIISQPAPASVCPSGNTSFTVAASGAGTSYKWQLSTNGGVSFSNISTGGVYSGDAAATLVITGATPAMQGYKYRAVASGSCKPLVITADTSKPALLTINTFPSVTNPQPANAASCAGGNTSFTVNAIGTGLSYQWQVSSNGGQNYTNVSKGVLYSNTTSPTLSLTGVSKAIDGYTYRALISGVCLKSDSSKGAVLTINTFPAVTGSPQNTGICNGGNTGFSVLATGSNLSYLWQVSSNGAPYTNLTDAGIYSNTTKPNLILTGATLAVDANKYRAVVSGTCSPADTSLAALLTVNILPKISVQPTPATACIGTARTFSATASGTGISYQWQLSTNSGATYSNLSNSATYTNVTTGILSVTGVTAGMNGYRYRLVASGLCPPADTSGGATLGVTTATVVSTNPIDTTICSGGNTSFKAMGTGQGLSYQWQLNADSTSFKDLVSNGFYSNVQSQVLNIKGAISTMNNYKYQVVITDACGSRTTSGFAFLTVNSGSTGGLLNPDTAVCPGSNSGLLTLKGYRGTILRWESSNDGFKSIIALQDTTASFTFNNILAATSYRVAVKSGVCPTINSSQTTISIKGPDKITLGNDTMTLCEGKKLSLTAPSGFASYQWQDGSTTLNYNVSSPGFYQVKAIDNKGCTAQGAINIGPCNSIFIPDAFTPNKDGFNEYFVIKGQRPNSEITIYNRWGTVVYHSFNYENNWDGGTSVDGVYYYIYKRKDDKTYTGAVELLR